MSRLNSVNKNVFFGYLSNILSLFVGFASRSIFIYFLGTLFLGLNGLFTNILSVLSLAELGIGSVISYALYKPVSLGNYSKVKGILLYFQRVYFRIFLSIIFLGLLIIPFLQLLIKDVIGITPLEIIIYYSLFLINTASSYLVTYRYSFFQAEQKSYLVINIDLIVGLLSSLIQIFVIFSLRSYLAYLLIGLLINVFSKLLIIKYINNRMNYLSNYKVEKLNEIEKVEIKRNIKSLIFHKIGEVSIHQTDNIIISSLIGINFVGLLSNYNLIINSVSKFINTLISSVIGSLGNLIAIENKQKQFEIFKVYRFVAFWIYGFSSISFLVLTQRFIVIWIGNTYLLSITSIYIIFINFYFMGHRIIINNFKNAAGIFYRDRYLSIIEGMTNLVISVILVSLIGLNGVFLGTLISGLITSFIRPILIYKEYFGINPLGYFWDSVKFISTILFILFILIVIDSNLSFENNLLEFLVMIVLTFFISNFTFIVFFHNRKEFKYIIKAIQAIIMGVKSKYNK